MAAPFDLHSHPSLKEVDAIYFATNRRSCALYSKRRLPPSFVVLLSLPWSPSGDSRHSVIRRVTLMAADDATTTPSSSTPLSPSTPSSLTDRDEARRVN